jgi:uncharacterized protein involved in type VI secretion and phage assembly
MSLIEIDFASGEGSLSARRFSVHEQMSSLFSISLWARSPHEDIDLEEIVGQEATLRLASGIAFASQGGGRSWKGICCSMELLHAEPTGLSTYYLRIVPRLWLLTQKSDHKLYQHASIPAIVTQILASWNIAHDWRVDTKEYPKLDLRSQYGESDYAFMCRLLEEAGISFFFSDVDGETRLVLSGAPQSGEVRTPALPVVDGANQSAEKEFAASVRLAQDVRPGRVTLRDHDFRQGTKFQLFGATPKLGTLEDALEQYVYRPGTFLVEMPDDMGIQLPLPQVPLPPGVSHTVGAIQGGVGAVKDTLTGAIVEKAKGAAADAVRGAVGGVVGEVAGQIAGGLAGKLAGAIGRLLGDDKGAARFDPKAGQRRAAIESEAIRTGRRRVSFETNALDLAPGVVLQIDGLGRKDLSPDSKLLVTQFMVEGTPDGEWSMSAEAVFADAPYRPSMKTPKPSITGIQSAIIVGPAGEEIHTDELGRVRAQFHWDRENAYSDNSSCWMRVSQGWAGGRFGMICIPRIGQEVLVAFLEGDPDHPVVVGRVYNAASPVPWHLPANKTKSGWKSDSTPMSNGFNELSFEDAKGRELVYMQAEKNLDTLVKNDESRSVGSDRRTTIGAVDSSFVGSQHVVTMKQADAGKITPTMFEMVDRRIRFTTGEASITLDGPNITLEAKGRIFVHSTDDDVEILGGPWVKINCDPPKPGESDTYTMHHITGVVRDQDDKPLTGQVVVVKASDGLVQQVTTDGSGKYFALVPPGKCQVSLPGGLHYGTQGSALETMTLDPEELDDSGPAA